MKNQKTIQIKTKRGFILNAIEGDTITQAIQAKGEYDTNTLNSLTDILSQTQPRTSLDVGANIGNHAVLIAQYSQQLIAFEPVAFVYDLLQSNLKQNHLCNAFSVNKGLSNSVADREIFIPAFNLGCSSLEVKVGDGQSLQISTAVGDEYLQEYCKNQQIDFIKMDIEGHEAAALIGLEKTIKQYQPLLLIEWKSPHTLSTFKQQNLLHRLFANYQFYSLTQTDNKKLYAKNLKGFFQRIYCKCFNKTWCLSSFDSNKTYSNVYLVPARYADLFSRLQYKSRISS